MVFECGLESVLDDAFEATAVFSGDVCFETYAIPFKGIDNRIGGAPYCLIHLEICLMFSI